MMIQPTTLRAIAANALPIQTDGEISNLCLRSTHGPILIHRALIASGGCMAIIAAPDIINNPALAKAISAQLLNTSFPSHNMRQFSFPSQNSRHTRFPPRNTRHTSLPTIASAKTTCENQKHATPNAPRIDHSVPVSISDLVLRHTSLFQTEISHVSLCKAGEHAIETFPNKPITCPTTRVPVHWEKDVEADIAKHLRLGIIRELSSPWNSHIVPVKKKDGSIRLCSDYRPLNKITIGDRYPVPRIDEILDTLADASVFSTLDATSGYFQLALKPEDIPKTAFSWKGGHYEFTRMPFGLCNAPATFQRAMDTVFRREKWRFVIPYFDDIIIFSKSMEEHQRHLEIILIKIRAASLSLNPRKCKFAQHEMEILENLVSKGQVKPLPSKLTAVREYKLPATIKDLRAFLGFAGYVHGFAPNFASLAKPLTELLKGESKTSIRTIAWPEDARKAFSAIKDILSSGLKRAQPDFSKSFIQFVQKRMHNLIYCVV
ncbi:hypothetical protein PAPHI01_2494 [Pancytospora philotis]|nr:hypothetical protein PAPHI01_2494 [Pancytospora philotis]